MLVPSAIHPIALLVPPPHTWPELWFEIWLGPLFEIVNKTPVKDAQTAVFRQHVLHGMVLVDDANKRLFGTLLALLRH